ncbi:hypothetical protein Peur_017858 [Populus x canadensis]
MHGTRPWQPGFPEKSPPKANIIDEPTWVLTRLQNHASNPMAFDLVSRPTSPVGQDSNLFDTSLIPLQPRINPNGFFLSLEALSDSLKPRISTTDSLSWGVKPSIKSIQNLWLEISEGETDLENSIPSFCVVHCMVVRILSSCGTKKILPEAQQELSDDSFRPQGRSQGKR